MRRLGLLSVVVLLAGTSLPANAKIEKFPPEMRVQRSRHGNRSSLELALEASTRAILDAGLTAKDVDGLIVVSEPAAPPPPR